MLGEDHDAEVLVVRGGRRRALTEQAERADLLVIGRPITAAADPGAAAASIAASLA